MTSHNSFIFHLGDRPYSSRLFLGGGAAARPGDTIYASTAVTADLKRHFRLRSLVGAPIMQGASSKPRAAAAGNVDALVVARLVDE